MLFIRMNKTILSTNAKNGFYFHDLASYSSFQKIKQPL